jgi:site-specific DNA-methyltransferase (cytosine-N4-specific)
VNPVQLDVVYFKDARNMEEVCDEMVTLIVTSPPYWTTKDYSLDGYQREATAEPMAGQIGDMGSYEDYLCALNAVWRECERVLKPNGKLCINAPIMPLPKRVVNDRHIRQVKNLYSDIEHEVLKYTKLALMDVYIWNRTNPTKRLMFGSYPYPPNFYAQNTVEFIGVFVKDGPPEKRQDDIKMASILTEEEWTTLTRQVWNIPIPNSGDEAYGEHPAIMPIEMAQRLVKLFSFVGDVVLDPFMGSGTTARAAQDLARHYIGYEVNPNYASTIERKLARQLHLL